MEMDKEFKPFLDDRISGIKHKSSPKHTVIKTQLVNMQSPLKVEIDESDFEDEENESIEPIVEDGEIMGVIHKCSCGKVAKIRFEYMKTQESSKKIKGS